jgi:hypothetical protein
LDRSTSTPVAWCSSLMIGTLQQGVLCCTRLQHDVLCCTRLQHAVLCRSELRGARAFMIGTLL